MGRLHRDQALDAQDARHALKRFDGLSLPGEGVRGDDVGFSCRLQADNDDRFIIAKVAAELVGVLDSRVPAGEDGFGIEVEGEPARAEKAAAAVNASKIARTTQGCPTMASVSRIGIALSLRKEIHDRSIISNDPSLNHGARFQYMSRRV